MSGYGMKSHLMVNFQDSFGTSQVSSLRAVAITGETFTANIEQLTEANMYGRFSESPYHQGIFTVEAEVTQEASPASLGHFLKSVIGLVSTTSDTNTQTHVFKPRTADFDQFAATDLLTTEVYRDVGSAFLFYDLCGNTLSIDIANGQLMTMTAGFIGAGSAKKEASSPTFPTAKPFKWDQTSSTFNSVPLIDIQNLTINVNNNLAARHILQTSNSPHKIKRTAQQTIEITGTLTFQQHSYYDAYINETEVPLVLNFETDQAPNQLTIDIPRLRMKSATPTITGAGVIEMPFTAGAMFDTGSNTAIEVTLVNTVEYY